VANCGISGFTETDLPLLDASGCLVLEDAVTVSRETLEVRLPLDQDLECVEAHVPAEV